MTPILIGVDEVGRGCLAGPVFAAAVILEKDFYHQDLQDSKQISDKKRRILSPLIKQYSRYSITMLSAAEIDEYNIYIATKMAMLKAIKELEGRGDIVMIDGNMKFEKKNYYSVIKGDEKIMAISAASIIAKVARDDYMIELSNNYPNYGWHQNKGYGTKMHILSIQQYNLTPFHRKSFCSRIIINSTTK